MHERKCYEFKAALDENILRGAAAVMGNLDAGDDVIFPGAFKGGVLSRFLKNGFVSDAHEWSWESMLCMPTQAKEEGNQLLAEAVFHSTPRAQAARTVARERIERGLSVGLSIGFQSDFAKGVHWFDTGENLLQYAKDNAYPLDLFDVKSIAAHNASCRGITRMAELFEFSIVPVPMNAAAMATEAKQRRLWLGYRAGEKDESLLTLLHRELTERLESSAANDTEEDVSSSAPDAVPASEGGKQIDLTAITSERTLEAALRDAGLSKSCAVGLVAKFKTVLRGEPVGDAREPDTAVEPPVQKQPRGISVAEFVFGDTTPPARDERYVF